jgi:hypothetical protein
LDWSVLVIHYLDPFFLEFVHGDREQKLGPNPGPFLEEGCPGEDAAGVWVYKTGPATADGVTRGTRDEHRLHNDAVLRGSGMDEEVRERR